MDAHLLGIDWGTSNRRAYLVDRAGACLRRHADDQGLLAVNGGFAASLAALRRLMQVDAAVPVVMAGMVGSASGWQEVPYLGTDVALDDLPRHLVAVGGGTDVRIVPGYVGAVPDVDVMRGEETQLLGAGVRDGWIVLPGTHSKWVYLRAGRIERLSTFMTGR
jgi:2-dehydro-3-deoxygalactonokinase